MPADVTAAYLAEDRRQPALIGIVVVTTLSFIVVMVRLYVRKFLIRELGWDDFFILLAQVSPPPSTSRKINRKLSLRQAHKLGNNGSLHDDSPVRLRETSPGTSQSANRACEDVQMARHDAGSLHVQPVALSGFRPGLLRSTQPHAAVHFVSSTLVRLHYRRVYCTDPDHCSAMHPTRRSLERSRRKMHGIQGGLYFHGCAYDCLRLSDSHFAREDCHGTSGKDGQKIGIATRSLLRCLVSLRKKLITHFVIVANLSLSSSAVVYVLFSFHRCQISISC